jgi:hypothetical protein
MKRAVVLAHFDRDGVVDPCVVAAVQAYRPLADTLLLVSVSAGKLPRALDGVVDGFLPRDNVGYDFGSWQAGVRWLGDPQRYDEILFVNDSVYGPLFDLRPALEDPRGRAFDLWGMVMSAEREPHVQSWCFAMRRPILESPAFTAFWESVAPQPTKEDVVNRYEVGMSQFFKAAGFQAGAVIDSRDEPPPTIREMLHAAAGLGPLGLLRHIRQLRRRGPPYNPSELLWRRLWQAGVPFLKAGIFSRNQYAIDPRQVLADLGSLAPAWGDLVMRHQARRATGN